MIAYQVGRLIKNTRVPRRPRRPLINDISSWIRKWERLTRGLDKVEHHLETLYFWRLLGFEEKEGSSSTTHIAIVWRKVGSMIHWVIFPSLLVVCLEDLHVVEVYMCCEGACEYLLNVVCCVWMLSWISSCFFVSCFMWLLCNGCEDFTHPWEGREVLGWRG